MAPFGAVSHRFFKPTGKRPLGRPMRRREDKIRMDLEEIGINAGNWVMLLIVHQCFLMTLSRKIIVFKQSLQATNKFFLRKRNIYGKW